jgi:hypothetical protein
MAVAVVWGFFAVDKILEVCLGSSTRKTLIKTIKNNTFLEPRGAIIEALSELLHPLKCGTR